MIPKYDLLVIGRDDQRVHLVAETDLSQAKAESCFRVTSRSSTGRK